MSRKNLLYLCLTVLVVAVGMWIHEFHGIYNHEKNVLFRQGSASQFELVRPLGNPEPSNGKKPIDYQVIGGIIMLLLLTAIGLYRFTALLTKETNSRKEIEQKLEELAAFQDIILKNAPVGVIICKPEYNSIGSITDYGFSFYNETAKYCVANASEDWMSAKPALSLNQSVMGSLLDAVKEVTVRQEANEVVQIGQRAGEQFFIETQMVPVPDGVLLLRRDISQLRRAENELKHRNEQLQQLLDSALTVTVLVQGIRNKEGAIADFRLLYGNQKFFQFIRHSAEQVIGATFLQAHPNLSMQFMSNYLQVIECGEGQVFEQCFPWRGEERWFLVSAQPEGEDKLIISLVEKTAEKKLQAQTDYIQRLLEGSLNGLVALQPVRSKAGALVEFRVLTINMAARKLLKIKSEEDARSFQDYITHAQDSELFSCFEGVLVSGNPLRREIFLDTPIVRGWFELNVVQSEDNLIVSFIDITSLIESQQQLKETVANLEKANTKIRLDVERLERAETQTLAALEKEKEINAFQSRFVTLVSHEFRTPMSTILSATDILKMLSEISGESVLGQKLPKYVDQIAGEVHRLNRLISEVLVMEQFHSGRIRMNIKELSLAAFCREHILKRQSQTPTYERVQFLAELTDDVLHFDPVMMEHVLENLINNALKYSAESAKPVIVSVSSHLGKARVSVRDEGIGIPEAELARLGESFFRASNTLKTSGTGLGFSLARQLVEMQGGRLQIESVENAYTVCRVELPIAFGSSLMSSLPEKSHIQEA